MKETPTGMQSTKEIYSLVYLLNTRNSQLQAQLDPSVQTTLLEAVSVSWLYVPCTGITLRWALGR